MRLRFALISLTILTLSRSPGAADTYPRQPGIDVESYRFELVLSDETDEISGRTTVHLRFVEEDVESLTLDLVGKASPDAAEGMVVHDVRWLGSDTPTDIVFENDRLTIPVAGRPEAGQTASVQIDYSGTAATGLQIGANKHGDRTFFSDNWPDKARHWLPTIDHPYDKAAAEMVVTAPAQYQVVSNGRLVEETDLPDGRRRTHWRQSIPIATWLNTLGVARFAVQHLAEVDGIPVQTWVYPQDRDAGFYDFAVPTPHALEFFSERIGPYSYEKLANVQSNSVGGGMESATAIFYGDDAVSGRRSERWRNVIIHEVAHQWWGNSVTESDWDDVWLSEGFATYFTMLFVEHAYGRDAMVELLERSRDYVLKFADEHPHDTVVHRNLDDMSRVLSGNIYQKGAWTLHMLRQIVGDEAFWAGIRDYYGRYRNAHATTRDFQQAMEEASGQDLQSFFEQWLHRGGVPQLRGGWSHEAEHGVLRLHLEQAGSEADLYRMPVELLITDSAGERRLEVVDLAEPRHEVEIAMERAPQSVVLDPDLKVLMRVSFERQ